jgi:hypothetical protein
MTVSLPTRRRNTACRYCIDSENKQYRIEGSLSRYDYFTRTVILCGCSDSHNHSSSGSVIDMQSPTRAEVSARTQHCFERVNLTFLLSPCRSPSSSKLPVPMLTKVNPERSNSTAITASARLAFLRLVLCIHDTAVVLE